MPPTPTETPEVLTLETAWAKYNASVEHARAAMTKLPRLAENPAHKTLVYHSLAEAQAMAYTFAVAPRMDAPLVHTRHWFSYFYTLGGTSPDFFYGALFLDGRKTYRLTGSFGDLRMILLQGYSHLMGHPDCRMLGNFDLAAFKVEDDGRFEVILSATRHDGNWIPLAGDSRYNFFFIRRALADWNQDRGTLNISLVADGTADAELPDVQAQARDMAERLSLAGDFLRYLTINWCVDLYDLYLKVNEGEKNRVAVIPGSQIAADLVGSPTTNYIWGIYDIADDEALIIESELPQARYWSVQLFDVLCRPFDFVHRQTDVNLNRAVIDEDGKLRLVIARTDPGVANWLDSCGTNEGIIVGRNYHPEHTIARPVTRKVKLSELASALPPGTRRITPEERAAALDYRRRGYLQLYRDS